MDKKKIHLTNEELTKNFKNNFDLVNYAIKLAENMIKTGRDARVKSEIQNRAMLILEEIVAGKDQLDQIPEHFDDNQDFEKEVKARFALEEKLERQKYKAVERLRDDD